ncbi:MAG: thiamine diphosphokinase [Peptococcaceae bacterium]|nr:thiamine diphosphokinase [Peptococcaceae bacterium]
MYIVVAHGEWDVEWGKKILQGSEVKKVIAADGGADWTVMCGRMPDIVIGDLDSVTGETLALCEHNRVCIERYPQAKNETDLELALDWAHEQAGPDEVVLVGAGGGRVDQWLGNIGLLIKYAELGRRVSMRDAKSEAWVMGPGRQDLEAYQGCVFSVLPLSAEVEAGGAGLEYPLDRLVLYRKRPRGVSNIVGSTGPNWLEIYRGTALLVALRDCN